MSEDSEASLIDELIKRGEGVTIEFKKSDILSNSFELAKLMTAFANTAGGRILIGVCDDGKLEGMKKRKEHEVFIMNVARDKCDPPLTPEFSVINKPEGNIYVIKILRYRKVPHAVKTKEGNVYFIRVGSTIRVASPDKLALLFEAAQKELVSKRPEIDLSLIDAQGNVCKELYIQPKVFKRVVLKKEKTIETPESEPSVLSAHLSAAISELLKQQTKLLESISKQPPEDLFPIGVEVSNIGEIPAEGIRIFLKFPEEVKIFEESEFKGPLYLLDQRFSAHGGLFADKGRNEAFGWIDILGNDLTMKLPCKVYVKFPEIEKEYKIEGTITQYYFPPKNFEFKVTVKPVVIEKLEYVYE